MLLVLLPLFAFAQDASADPADEGASSASADANKERARELFQNASVLYEEGNYEAALAALKEANTIFPNPALNFNIANCLERLGRYDEAIRSMDLYRATAPASERATLDRRMSAMQKRRDDEAAAEAARVAAAATGPTEGRTVYKSGPTWPLVGAGGALAVIGGVGAAVSYSGSRKNLADLDRSAYGSSRTLNGISLATAGLGVGVAALGVVLQQERKVIISGDVKSDGARVQIGGAW